MVNPKIAEKVSSNFGARAPGRSVFQYPCFLIDVFSGRRPKESKIRSVGNPNWANLKISSDRIFFDPLGIILRGKCSNQSNLSFADFRLGETFNRSIFYLLSMSTGRNSVRWVDHGKHSFYSGTKIDLLGRSTNRISICWDAQQVEFSICRDAQQVENSTRWESQKIENEIRPVERLNGAQVSKGVKML